MEALKTLEKGMNIAVIGGVLYLGYKAYEKFKSGDFLGGLFDVKTSAEKIQEQTVKEVIETQEGTWIKKKLELGFAPEDPEAKYSLGEVGAGQLLGETIATRDAIKRLGGDPNMYGNMDVGTRLIYLHKELIRLIEARAEESSSLELEKPKSITSTPAYTGMKATELITGIRTGELRATPRIIAPEGAIIDLTGLAGAEGYDYRAYSERHKPLQQFIAEKTQPDYPKISSREEYRRLRDVRYGG